MPRNRAAASVMLPFLNPQVLFVAIGRFQLSKVRVLVVRHLRS